MAKHRSEGEGVQESGNGLQSSEFVCEQDKWEYVESHIGSYKLQTSGKRPPVVIGRDVLQPTDETGRFLKATPNNRNGFRYWQRRVLPVMGTNQTVDEYLSELEKFDAADVLVFPEGTSYVVGTGSNATKFVFAKETRQPKKYKVMVDAKGQPISREQYHKLMMTGAVTLALQKHLQNIMRDKAEELYEELGIERPIAGQRGRASAPQNEQSADSATEGMDE